MFPWYLLSLSRRPLQLVAINTETSSPTLLSSCCHIEFYTIPREFHAFTTAWLCEFIIYLVFFLPKTTLHTQNGISSVNLFSLSHIINLLTIKQWTKQTRISAFTKLAIYFLVDCVLPVSDSQLFTCNKHILLSLYPTVRLIWT